MKQLVGLVTLLCTFNAAAGCPSATPNRTPEIPDGLVASEQSMFAAMADVRSYVDTIEAYLACSDNISSDRRHDELVHQARDVAGAYNRELQRYRQREAALAQN